MRRNNDGELVIEERERQAITELASDITTLWSALEPIIKSMAGTVGSAAKEDRRLDNIGIIKGIAEELSYR